MCEDRVVIMCYCAERLVRTTDNNLRVNITLDDFVRDGKIDENKNKLISIRRKELFETIILLYLVDTIFC